MSGIKFIKKPIVFIIVISLAILGVVGSAVSVVVTYEKELKLQFEDVNGEDKSLARITNEMIEEYREDYRALKRKVSTKGHPTSGVTGHFSDCDYDHIETKIGKLSGIYVCNAYLGKGREVTYNIDSTVHSGNLKIVITNENDDIIYDVPIDSKETVSFFAEESKLYYVKFVGESAELEIDVFRED